MAVTIIARARPVARVTSWWSEPASGPGDPRRDRQPVLADRQEARPGEERRDEPLPQQNVGQPRDQRPPGPHGQRHEDGRVGDDREQRAGQHAQQQSGRVEPEQQEAGDEDRRAAQAHAGRRRHEHLRQHDPGAAHGLDEEMHHGSIVDLGADRRRAEDQRHQRHDRRHHERVVELPHQLVGRAQPATDDQHRRDPDGSEGEQSDQHDPAPSQEAARGEVDERAEHRRAEDWSRRMAWEGRRYRRSRRPARHRATTRGGAPTAHRRTR